MVQENIGWGLVISPSDFRYQVSNVSLFNVDYIVYYVCCSYVFSVAEEEYERAAMLAEKYLDFQILIDVCQKTNNKEKINYYMDKFKHQVNVKFVFNSYLFCLAQFNVFFCVLKSIVPSNSV